MDFAQVRHFGRSIIGVSSGILVGSASALVGSYLLLAVFAPINLARDLLGFDLSSLDNLRYVQTWYGLPSWGLIGILAVAVSAFGLGWSFSKIRKASPRLRTKIVLGMLLLGVLGVLLAASVTPAFSSISASGGAGYTLFSAEPCSYYVFTDGTYYYGQACNTGATVYGGPSNAGGADGTNAATVIGDVINASAAGLTDVVDSGTYALGNSTLFFPDTIQRGFEFTASDGAVFTYSGTGDAVRFDSMSFAVVSLGQIIGQNQGNGVHVIPTHPNTMTDTTQFTSNSLSVTYIRGFNVSLDLDLGTTPDASITSNDIYVQQITAANWQSSNNFTTNFYGIVLQGSGASGQEFYQNFITSPQISPGPSKYGGHYFVAILDGNPNLQALTYPQYNLWKVGLTVSFGPENGVGIDCYADFEQFSGTIGVVESGTGIKIEAGAKDNTFDMGKIEASTLAEAISDDSQYYNQVFFPAYQVLGWQITTPAVPASGTPIRNPYPFPVDVYITGTGSGITAYDIHDWIGGGKYIVATVAVGWNFELQPAENITLFYTGSPTWAWYGEP